jgi:ubiquinone/menaquinone biosynthesis C-methylase UbiE
MLTWPSAPPFNRFEIAGVPMPVLDHFSLIAPLYERFFGLAKPEGLLARMNLRPGQAVLDAGGGTGRVAQWLCGEGRKIFIVDPSFSMLRQAAAKKGLYSVCAEAEQLPFSSGTFDRALMVDAFHHVKDQGETVSSLMRVIKMGGQLVIEEPDIRKPGVKVIAAAEKILLMRSHFLSPEKIRRLVFTAGSKARIEAENSTAWVIVEKSYSEPGL